MKTSETCPKCQAATERAEIAETNYDGATGELRAAIKAKDEAEREETERQRELAHAVQLWPGWVPHWKWITEVAALRVAERNEAQATAEALRAALESIAVGPLGLSQFSYEDFARVAIRLATEALAAHSKAVGP